MTGKASPERRRGIHTPNTRMRFDTNHERRFRTTGDGRRSQSSQTEHMFARCGNAGGEGYPTALRTLRPLREPKPRFRAEHPETSDGSEVQRCRFGFDRHRPSPKVNTPNTQTVFFGVRAVECGWAQWKGIRPHHGRCLAHPARRFPVSLADGQCFTCLADFA